MKLYNLFFLVVCSSCSLNDDNHNTVVHPTQSNNDLTINVNEVHFIDSSSQPLCTLVIEFRAVLEMELNKQSIFNTYSPGTLRDSKNKKLQIGRQRIFQQDSLVGNIIFKGSIYQTINSKNELICLYSNLYGITSNSKTHLFLIENINQFSIFRKDIYSLDCNDYTYYVLYQDSKILGISIFSKLYKEYFSDEEKLNFIKENQQISYGDR